MDNLSQLTRSHRAVAAKKRARKQQIEQVVFDDDARREYLTGFHKRKLAKSQLAKSKAIEREKQERLETRREQRKALREQALENAAQVEAAYGAVLEASDSDDDDSSGISPGKGKHKATDAYEDEETLATVTVVEDLDPDEFTHGPARPVTKSASVDPHRILPKPTPEVTKPTHKSKDKPKKIRYGTKASRKTDRSKQRARRTEKAERAGGKASRLRPKGSKRKH